MNRIPRKGFGGFHLTKFLVIRKPLLIRDCHFLNDGQVAEEVGGLSGVLLTINVSKYLKGLAPCGKVSNSLRA